MSFVIQKNVPLPPDPRGRPMGSKYADALAQMQVGDCITGLKPWQAQRFTQVMQSKKLEYKLASRTAKDNTITVWRTA